MDMNRLAEALLAADRAGDDESARVLAQAIRQQQGFQEQAAGMDEMDLSVARSKNDDFGNYLREQATQERPGESPQDRETRLYGVKPPEVGTAEGATRAYLQGGTFGFGDEIVGAGQAAIDKFARGDDFGRSYDYRVKGERAKLDQFREDSPALAMGAEIGGAIPSAMLPFMGGPKAVTGLGKVVAGGVTGAAEGAAYGAGTSEGGLGPRAVGAAKMGAISAPLGMAGPPVAAGARNLANKIQTRAGAVGMSAPAYDALTNAMDADQSLYGAGAARLDAVGPDAMLADAGPNATAMLDAAIQKSGPAATVARQAVDQRVANSGRRVAGAMDNALGIPGQSQSRALMVYGDKTNPVDLIYKRAYATPIDYASEGGRKIEAIVRGRVPKSAIDSANALMRVEGAKSKQILADIAEDGTVVFKEMPDVRQIDYITRGLNEVADAANGQGKLGGTTQTGRAYGNLSRELRRTLKDEVPAYRDALKSSGGLIREGKAKEFGNILLSPRVTRDEAKEMVSDMGEAELRKVAEGLRMQIDDTLANVKRTLTDPNVDARESIKAIKDLSSRASREKVSAVIGKDKAAALFSELDQATEAFNLRARVADNSKTFARTQMDDAIRARTEDGIVNAARSGEPVNAGKRLIQALTGRTEAAKQKAADKVYVEVVDKLVGPRGRLAQDLLKQLEASRKTIGPRSEAAGRIAEGMMRRNAAVTAPATHPYR